jgi:hypothetical protein
MMATGAFIAQPLPSRGVHKRAVAALADEIENLVHMRMVGEFAGDVLDALLQRAFRREQQTVGAAQIVDRLARKAATLEADEIEAGEAGAIAEGHAEGNEIVLDAGEAADEGVLADAHELMHRRAAAEDAEIADRDMAGEHDVVRQDDVRADAAIMRDMGIGEERRSDRRPW